MYGENGEVEYGGDMRNAFKAQRDIKDQEKHYFSSINPEAWANFGLSIKELYPFLAPPYKELIKNKTEIHFYGYYHYWDPQENYYYTQKYTY